jgi:hypothetical protein
VLTKGLSDQGAAIETNPAGGPVRSAKQRFAQHDLNRLHMWRILHKSIHSQLETKVSPAA